MLLAKHQERLLHCSLSGRHRNDAHNAFTAESSDAQDIHIIYNGTAGTLKHIAVNYFCLLYDPVQQKQPCRTLHQSHTSPAHGQ